MSQADGARVEALEQRVAELEERIAQLEEQVGNLRALAEGQDLMPVMYPEPAPKGSRRG